MRLGRHMPVTPAPKEALRLTREVGGDATQIFVTNPRAWRPPAEKPAEAEAFRALRAELGSWPVAVHASYLINLASSNPEVAEKSAELLRVTMERAALVEAQAVIFHSGSHTGSGEEAGLARIIAGVDRALDGLEGPGPLLLLENDTGGGGKMGARFETLARALDALPRHAERLGVCLDTAHLWGAGYDISTAEGAVRTLDEADNTFGLARVPVWHLNDAKAGLGSHLDRHARLGEGEIPLEGLTALLRDQRLAEATLIMETPLTTLGDASEEAPDDASATKTDWAAERERFTKARALAGQA
ncbi:MAG TPA: deoxyribonuclease IV [Ktedonobacterales bacterium]